jgi:hypothetical protein
MDRIKFENQQTTEDTEEHKHREKPEKGLKEYLRVPCVSA